MIGYVTLGTNDLQGNAKFYDAIAKEMGVGRMMDEDTFIAWGEMGGPAGVAITKPFDGNAPSVGNGTMVAFQAESQQQVRDLHAAALSAGGTNEGAPGFREAYSADFYVAYLRDPQGNKLALFTTSP